MKYVKVASVSDVPSDEALQVEVDGEKVALVNCEGTVCAISDICTHEHAFLSEGFVEGNTIECPLHGSVFDLRTGVVQSLPATDDAKTYDVKVEGDDVLLGVDDG